MQKKLYLAGIILLYVILKSLIFTNGMIFADEAVYISNAENLAGKETYFESLRPIALPFLLAPLEILGLLNLWTARILSLLLAAGSIIALYWAARLRYGEEAGLWAAFLTATSTLVLEYTGYALTGLPAYSLALLGISLATEKKPFAGGILVGVGFLFRFPAALLGVPAFFWLLKDQWKDSLRYAAGGIAGIPPYLIFNSLRYEGSILSRLADPLLEASAIIPAPGQADPGLFRYAQILAGNEPFLLVAAIAAILLSKKDWLYPVTGGLVLAYFSWGVERIEHRYILPVVLVMALIVSSQAFRVPKEAAKVAVVVFVLQAVIVTGMLETRNYPHTPGLEKTFEGKDIFTNTALALPYSSSGELFTGSNFARTYREYVLSGREILVLSFEEFICWPEDAGCIDELNARANLLAANSGVIACGVLHNHRVMIINNGSLSREECLESLGIPLTSLPDQSTFIRINEVRLDERGDIPFMERIAEIANHGIPTYLVFKSEGRLPSQKSLEFIASLPENVEIGILPLDKDVTGFIEAVEKSGREVTAITSTQDVWDKEMKDMGMETCLRGAWDKSTTTIPCREVDMFTYSLEEKMFRPPEELIRIYEAYQVTEPEIGIDIPGYALNAETFENLEPLLSAAW